jgi:hypothetical protein
MEITRQAYPVQVLTATHEVTGTYQPIGQFMNAINNPGSTCFPLHEASYTPLATGVTLRSISVPQLTVGKNDIQFICFQDDTLKNELHMLKRVARMILYTPAFALRGEVHLGVEDQPHDMLDTLRGQFQPLTDATIFPLHETRASVKRQHSLIVVNTQAIHLYHPDHPD